MNHNDIYNQTHKRAKGAAAIISIALAGTIILVGCNKAGVFRRNDAKAPVNPKPETTAVAPESSELVLTEDFDINDPAAVTKRAQDIYNLSEKKCGVLDIQNLIYIINEKYDNIIYPDTVKSDDAKFDYLQQLALALGTTLDDYLADYVVTMDQISNGKVSNPVFAGTTNPVPCAYMFMSQGSEVKQDSAATQNGKEKKSAKELAIEIGKVYYEQRANIRNNNLAAMTITANDYYNLYTKAKELELKTGDKYSIFKQFNAVNPIFTPFLSKEQTRDLDDSLGFITTSTNKLFSSASENLNLSERLRKDLEKGNFGKTITKLEEKYAESDRQAAEKRAEKSNESIATETKVVNQGGTPASGSAGKQEVIDGKVTTTVSESEFIVSIPNEGTSEEVISGGEVVEEHTTEPVTKPSTTKPQETTTYVDDEDIPVIDDKGFFGDATDEDIKDYYRKSLVK